MALAAEYGGGPAYWGLPAPADESVVATAVAMILDREKDQHRV